MLFIVIPFLNESENLSGLANDLRNFMNKHLSHFTEIKIILINDGSVDDSVQIIKSCFQGLHYEIINHSHNKGPGAAFQSGFNKIISKMSSEDYVLTLEADNTSNLGIVPEMISRSCDGYDVVLASPYIYGGTIMNTPFHRRILSFFANLFLRELLGLRGIFTISSFFRLYKGGALKNLYVVYGDCLIEKDGFEGKVEILMKLVFQKTRISEVPLILDTSRRKGRSKMKVIKTTLSLLSLCFSKKRWRKAIADEKYEYVTPSL